MNKQMIINLKKLNIINENLYNVMKLYIDKSFTYKELLLIRSFYKVEEIFRIIGFIEFTSDKIKDNKTKLQRLLETKKKFKISETEYDICRLILIKKLTEDNIRLLRMGRY